MSGKVISSFFSSTSTLLVLSLLLPGYILPQYETGKLPFLVNQQSPLLIGAGSIGAAIPMKDAMGFYYNPAQLGYFSRENNFSFFFMPVHAEWYDYQYWEDPGFISSGVTAGVNFKSTKSKLPLSIGVGYIHNKITYERSYTQCQDGTFYSSNYEDYDYFNCFSVGACYEYYLLFSLGLAVKPYKTILNDKYELPSQYISNGTAFDFGVMITAPIFDLLKYDQLRNSDGNIYKPKLDLTLGYSITNVGQKFDRFERANKSPLQRTARLGYTIDIGLDAVTTNNKIFNIIDYSFTAEVEDVLWKWIDKTDSQEYQNLLGDIKIGKNLIMLKPDSYVSIHKGHILRLAETAFISVGRNCYYIPFVIESLGFGISSEGILKLLAPDINSTFFSYIADHIKLEYYYAEENKGLNSYYRGMALYLKEIEL